MSWNHGLVVLILLAPSVIATPPARAQETALAAQPPVVAGELGGSGFERLSKALRVGLNIKVRDEQGQATRGRVLAVSDDQIVIARKRRGRDAEVMFASDSITSIERVDSTWNGAVLGVIGGVAATWVGWGLCGSCNDGNVLAVFMIGTLPFVGGALGHEIDIRINRRIWMPASEPKVSISPFWGADRFGVAAGVGF
jgi:hypothetical protein